MLGTVRRIASTVVRAGQPARSLLQKRTVAHVAGTMSDFQLALPSLLWRAEKLFPHKGIITDTGLEETFLPYGDFVNRCRKVGGLLDMLNVDKNARVGSFAWNNGNHMELWYGVPNADRVLHTLNIRLFPEQLTYIVNHAEDEVIFVDRSLIALMWPLASTFKTVKHFIVMDDGKGDIPDDPRILRYEELMENAPAVDFNVSHETNAASMCYTSGTTGMPKGVVYTHRSLYLHTTSLLFKDTLGPRKVKEKDATLLKERNRFASTFQRLIVTFALVMLFLLLLLRVVSERDVVLPVVPMFHANSWGLSHAAPATGATLVMPGFNLTPDHLANVLEKHEVTLPAGVPTIWMGMLPKLKGKRLDKLRTIACGGSAVPLALSNAYKDVTGIPITQAWGMTETSPLGSVVYLGTRYDDASKEEIESARTSIGIPVCGVEARIVDQQTHETSLPWDGKARGELQVRGPWVCSGYYNRDDSDESFDGDWLNTGDVATINTKGEIRLVDRAKDVIKSGGEWVSSVDVEHVIMTHPKVAEAAVFAVSSAKWMERPMAAVVVQPGEELTKEELMEYITPKMAKWWLPDHVEFIDEVPKTSVGKFDKKVLRKDFAHVQVE